MAKNKDFSVTALVEWLKTMPADEPYDWSDASNCLLGQWCQSKGFVGDALQEKSCNLGEDDVFYDIALREMSHCTFGEALQRASLALPQHHRGTENG